MRATLQNGHRPGARKRTRGAAAVPCATSTSPIHGCPARRASTSARSSDGRFRPTSGWRAAAIQRSSPAPSATSWPASPPRRRFAAPRHRPRRGRSARNEAPRPPRRTAVATAAKAAPSGARSLSHTLRRLRFGGVGAATERNHPRLGDALEFASREPASRAPAPERPVAEDDSAPASAASATARR